MWLWHCLQGCYFNPALLEPAYEVRVPLVATRWLQQRNAQCCWEALRSWFNAVGVCADGGPLQTDTLRALAAAGSCSWGGPSTAIVSGALTADLTGAVAVEY